MLYIKNLLFLLLLGGIFIHFFPGTTSFASGDMTFIKGGPTGDFYIGKYEVTNKEYCQFAHSHENPGDDLPVINVSWYDAVDYCKWLSSNTGQTYRLPTEAEWEYAYRAGSSTDYYWGENMNKKTLTCTSIDTYAWYCGNSGGHVHPVGRKRPNAWGLYDMSGNVWEWCDDIFKGSDGCRVNRGGCWFFSGSICHAGGSIGYSPNFLSDCTGFRIVREP